MLISSPRKKYECRVCHQKYSSIEEIRAHIKATHLVHVTCPLCDKLFPSKGELLKHKKLHFQVAPDSPSTSKQSEDVIQASKVNENKTEGGKSSCSSAENADVGSLDNNCEVVSSSSLSGHISESESITNEVESITNQNTPCFQESASSKPQPTILSEHLPQLGEESNECSAKHDSEGGKRISTCSSMCVPLEDDRSAISDIATSFNPETKANKEKCANEEISSVSCDSGTYFIIPYKETTYFQLPQYIEIPTNIVETSLKKNLDFVKCQSQEPKEYKCNMCEKKYDKIECVQSHIKEAHESFLTCLLCNEKFSSRSQYLSHSNLHLSGSWTLSERSEHRNGNLVRESSGEMKNANSSKAGGISPGEGKLKSSKSKKLKEYKCRLCQVKYGCVEDARNHIKKFHLPDLTCKLCDKIFESIHSLLEHAKVHNCNDPRSTFIQSDDCNSTCSNMLTLIGSEENSVHVDNQSKDCEDSDFTATGKSSGSDSCGQINKEECYKCNECSLFFGCVSALMLHQKMHKKVLYKCGVCEFASSSKKSVMLHLNQEQHSFQGEFNDDQ